MYFYVFIKSVFHLNIDAVTFCGPSSFNLLTGQWSVVTSTVSQNNELSSILIVSAAIF